MEYLDEEDVLEVVDDGDMSRAGSRLGDGDEGGDLAEEEVEEEAVESGPKEPSGPDTSIAQLRGHTSSVYAIAVSPDGALLASGGGDDVAVLWDVATMKSIATLRGHTDSVVAVAWSYTGSMLATAGLDSSVRVWDRAGALLHTIDGPSAEVEWLSWHPKGDVLLAGSDDATAWMWHVTPKPSVPPACMTVFAGHEGEVTCGAFCSTGGRMVATGSADGTARLWNPKSGRCIQTFGGHGWHESPINAIATSNTRPLLVTGGQDGTARLASIATFKVLGCLVHSRSERAGESSRGGAGSGGSGGSVDGDADEDDDIVSSVESVAFCESEAHPWVASGATDGTVLLWDLNSLAVRHRLRHEEAIVKVAWLPGAPLLAVATADGCLRVWDGRDGRLVVNHTGHAGLILDFAVIPEPAAPAPAPPAAAAAAAGAVSAPLEGVSAPSPAVAPGPDSVAVPAASDPSGAALTAKMASLAVPSAEEPSGVPVATGASVDAPPASRAPAPRGITIVTAGDDGVCRVYTVSA